VELKIHKTKNGEIAELVSDTTVINNVQDAVDLLGNVSYLGGNKVIVNQQQLTPEFFDLKTQIAGEILQKFSNYRMKMAIVGNFSEVNSKSLHDFIYESNKGGNIVFTSSIEEAIKKL